MSRYNLQHELCKPRLRPVQKRSAALLITIRFAVALLIIGGGTLSPLKISLNQSSAENPDAFIIENQRPDASGSTSDYSFLPVEPGLGKRYIIVSLVDQKLQAYENGERVMEAMVSTGSRTSPTPAGEYTIKNKYPRAYSRVAQLYMPYWMAFHYDGQHWLGFHELPEWGRGIKEGEEHLGLPFSGGCIRLGVGDAQKLYDWTEVGDKILIY